LLASLRERLIAGWNWLLVVERDVRSPAMKEEINDKDKISGDRQNGSPA
jgi:hypothetical protein